MGMALMGVGYELYIPFVH